MGDEGENLGDHEPQEGTPRVRADARRNEDALLEAAFRVVERHMGVVSITDTQVLRAERF